MKYVKLLIALLFFVHFNTNFVIGNDLIKIDNNWTKYSFEAQSAKVIVTTLNNLSKEYNITIDSIVLANPRWNFQLRFPKFPIKVYRNNSYTLSMMTQNATHNLRYNLKLYVYYKVDELNTQVVDLYNLFFEYSYKDIFNEFTFNQFGLELKNSLKQYLLGHNVLTYKEAREKMFGEIDNYNGKVECIYTGRQIETTGIPDIGQTGFNTEHTWPQAYFNEGDTIARSDIFHLYPSDETANSKRANYPFGNVVQVQWQNSGSKLGKNQTGETVFEPRDESKGNIARSMFYFALRYDNPHNFLNTQEKTLREWFYLDKVDSIEILRNQKISSIQNRYNPFISHPEFLERIYSLSTNEDFPKQDKPMFSKEYEEISTNYITSQQTYNLYITNAGNTTLELTDIEKIDANGGLVSQIQGLVLPVTIPIDSVLKIKLSLYEIPQETKQQTKLLFRINNNHYQVILEETNLNYVCESQENINLLYSNNELIIQSTNNSYFQSVAIYDYLGTKIFEKDIIKNDKKILLNLSNGVYFATLKAPNRLLFRKIIVNN